MGRLWPPFEHWIAHSVSSGAMLPARLDWNVLARSRRAWLHLNSCGPLLAFLANLIERAAIAVQRGFPTRQALIAFDYDIDEFRIEFDAVAHALGDFRGGKGGTAAEKRLIHGLAAFQVIEDWSPHQL